MFEATLEPAAFGRLCVETVGNTALLSSTIQPPSGGCVLKPETSFKEVFVGRASRLRAAVC